MDPVVATLSQSIRQRRKELGLTQAELATKLDYSEKTVSKWENGTGVPPTYILPRLALALQVSLDQLLYPPVTQYYCLGIDGGGTKTEFLLCDRTGLVLSRVVLGTSNPNDIGIDATLEVLRSGILQTCSAYPMHSIRVFAGLAGSETYDGGKSVQHFLSRFGFAQVASGSDARSAVATALGNADGVTVILGTGAVAYAQRDGQLHRFGGYGYFFGDECSGFCLGRDAICAALRQEDGTGRPTLLYKSVLAACGTETVLAHLGPLYAGGKRLIASFAPLVFEAYRAGDSVAAEILQTHTAAISRVIQNAAQIISARPVPVILCGGLTTYENILLPLLQAHLESPHFVLDVCREPVIWGALRLAGLEAPLKGYPKEESEC